MIVPPGNTTIRADGLGLGMTDIGNHLRHDHAVRCHEARLALPDARGVTSAQVKKGWIPKPDAKLIKKWAAGSSIGG